MLENNYKSENKRFTIIDRKCDVLSVGCKTVIDKGIITNYLINIEDCTGGLCILLDKNGNSMFSQVIL